MDDMVKSTLILETGESFTGLSPINQQPVQFGEVVFNTGMVGYVECLTDPSYHGQILTFTYPLIGNYGVPSKELWESDQGHANAMICDTLSELYARKSAKTSLLSWCQDQHISVMTNVDTRALTKCLREKGVVAGAIVIGDALPTTFPDINQQHLVKEVSIKKPVEIGHGEKTIIAIDCGMKQNIWRLLQKLPYRIKRVPYDYDLSQENYDAVFISNGPGDPTNCHETITTIKKLLDNNKPIFGICLGSQLMALAVGAKTYKLRFGHRSQNQPCLEIKTDRCYLTSQNHGYAIDEQSLPDDWEVTYRHLNDASIQGIAHKNKPFFAVQFHPEAAPGPVDTEFLFEKFQHAIESNQT